MENNINQCEKSLEMRWQNSQIVSKGEIYFSNEE